MLPTKNISSQLREAFRESIANKIGIEIRDSELSILEQKIWQRTKAIQLDAPEHYYQFLNIPSPDSDREWQHLTELLTNNESYFFRDRQQLNLLKERIFPEIIKQKRQQENLTLRVWSAGCSAGQEPYSLAIILREILPDINAWNLSIFGTDIDRQALSQARSGIYSEWSFRQSEPRIKQHYFESKANSYQIVPEIRHLVKFQKLNLVSDKFPQLFSDLRDIDVILCRNVFIYFGFSTISTILEKFYHTLHPSGYLLVGHSELANQNLSRFKVRVFPQSLIYQRRVDSIISRSSAILPSKSPQKLPVAKASAKLDPQKTPHTTSKKQIKPRNIKPKLVNLVTTASASSTFTARESSKLLQQAKQLWQQKQSHLAVKKAEQALAIQPQNISACCLLGKIYLELDRSDLAKEISDRALTIDPLNLEANYLSAEIALGQSDRPKAKKILKKILYLDSESLKALVELSLIYQQEGERTRAEKTKQRAIQILQTLPNARTLPTCKNLTVAELIFQLETNSYK